MQFQSSKLTIMKHSHTPHGKSGKSTYSVINLQLVCNTNTNEN